MKHSPRQLTWLLETHFRKVARTRIERMHDVHAAFGACWSKDGPRHFRELEGRLKEIALPQPESESERLSNG